MESPSGAEITALGNVLSNFYIHRPPLPPPCSSQPGQNPNRVNMLAFSLLFLRLCPSCDYLLGNRFSKTTLLFSSLEYSLHLCMPEMRFDGPRPLTASCLIFLLTKTSFLLSATSFSSAPSLPTGTIQA
jgi:hypothetical protein